MTFRTKVAGLSAAAVTLAVVAASAGTYVLVRDALEDELDRSLAVRFDAVRHHDMALAMGGAGTATQVVTADGSVRTPPGLAALPVSDEALAIAGGGPGGRRFDDVEVEGTRFRVLTVWVGHGAALQLGRPRDAIDASLDRTRTILIVVSLVGILLGGLLGLAVSGAATRPLRRLASSAESVAETGDLSLRVGISGSDEIGRLGSRFDAMLHALDTSEQAQRQLVADASHELRTPLTAARTNVELVIRRADLPQAEREAALAAALVELEELGQLVTDIVELAREGVEPPQTFEEVRLDEIAADAVERARRAAPGLTFQFEASPTVVRGVPARLHRAIGNLLDNARKWSPAGGTIEVTVHDGTLIVRDHGPGFAEDDLERVFERFYRAAAARGLPGSGLGLAIVRQVVATHGGTVEAFNAPGGGASVRLSLPESSPNP